MHIEIELSHPNRDTTQHWDTKCCRLGDYTSFGFLWNLRSTDSNREKMIKHQITTSSPNMKNIHQKPWLGENNTYLGLFRGCSILGGQDLKTGKRTWKEWMVNGTHHSPQSARHSEQQLLGSRGPPPIADVFEKSCVWWKCHSLFKHNSFSNQTSCYWHAFFTIFHQRLLQVHCIR